MADNREIQEEIQAVLTAAGDAIQVGDAQGVIKYVNPASTRVTGIPSVGRLGKRVFDVSPDGAPAQVLKTGRAVRHRPNRVKGTGVQVIAKTGNLLSRVARPETACFGPLFRSPPGVRRRLFQP